MATQPLLPKAALEGQLKHYEALAATAHADAQRHLTLAAEYDTTAALYREAIAKLGEAKTTT